MTSKATWPWNTGPVYIHTLLAKFMGPTWVPSGADRTQVGPMLAPGYTGTESCHHCACKHDSTFSPLIQSWIQNYTCLFGSVIISTHPCWSEHTNQNGWLDCALLLLLCCCGSNHLSGRTNPFTLIIVLIKGSGFGICPHSSQVHQYFAKPSVVRSCGLNQAFDRYHQTQWQAGMGKPLDIFLATVCCQNK